MAASWIELALRVLDTVWPTGWRERKAKNDAEKKYKGTNKRIDEAIATPGGEAISVITASVVGDEPDSVLSTPQSGGAGK